MNLRIKIINKKINNITLSSMELTNKSEVLLGGKTGILFFTSNKKANKSADQIGI